MLILAIESSCDDTAVAVIKNGHTVLSSCVATQTEHDSYGGVVPELAARMHDQQLIPVLQQALDEASVTMEEIDAIAVTEGPGLQTSLLVGTMGASMLSALYDIPVIGIHHIWGHLLSPLLEGSDEALDPEKIFPALVLTASGGHTELHVLESFTKTKELGRTLDDAAGEAFDKTARMLGLGYPGGPYISQWAEKGDPKAYKLPVITMARVNLDFSFSGLKAAVYRLVNEVGDMTDQVKADIAASFQWTVARTFEKKVSRAFVQNPEMRSLFFVGGVSANTEIREKLTQLCDKCGKLFFVPKKRSYSTDNAAMIGLAAYYQIKENPELMHRGFIHPDPRLKI